MISHPFQAMSGFRRIAVRTVALWLVLSVVMAGQVMHAPMGGHGSGQAMAAATAAGTVSIDPATTDPGTTVTGISTASAFGDACAGPHCGACAAFLAVPDGPIPALERLYRPPIDPIRA